MGLRDDISCFVFPVLSPISVTRNFSQPVGHYLRLWRVDVWEGITVLGHGAFCARRTIGRIGLVRFHVVAQEPNLCGWLMVRSNVKKTLSRFQTNFFLSTHSLGFFEGMSATGVDQSTESTEKAQAHPEAASYPAVVSGFTKKTSYIRDIYFTCKI